MLFYLFFYSSTSAFCAIIMVCDLKVFVCVLLFPSFVFLALKVLK